jgi:hypothetical protein
MSSMDVPWQPRRIERLIEVFPTGSAVVRVETDQGEGFLKALSNKAEPHNLACELVGTLLAGTLLAGWLKLPTLDFALIAVTAADRLQLADGTMAHPGPAFITRFEDGYPWGGEPKELDGLDNPEDIARLVVLDTWTRNCDRYLPREEGARVRRDNVFLSRRNATAGHFVLKAIDHGCCFTCARELTARLGDLDLIRDPQLYGCFPEFRGRIDRAAVLRIVQEVKAIGRNEVEAIVQSVPPEWDVSPSVRAAWCHFIYERARYIEAIFECEWPRLSLFDDEPGQETVT